MAQPSGRNGGQGPHLSWVSWTVNASACSVAVPSAESSGLANRSTAEAVTKRTLRIPHPRIREKTVSRSNVPDERPR